MTFPKNQISYLKVLVLSSDSLQVVSYWINSLCLPLCLTQRAVKIVLSLFPVMELVSPLSL